MSGYYGYELNWLGIAVAALVPMVLGFIWYSKPLFGKPWQKAARLTDEDVKGGNMPVIFGLAYLMAFTLAYYFAMRYHAHGEESNALMHGMYHGFMTGGYVAIPVLISNMLFERTGWKGVLINAGYWLLAVSLIAGVYNLMPGEKIPEPENGDALLNAIRLIA